MISKSKSALLIVGHGSTVNPHSSAPTLAHAATIRCQGIFHDVRCAFWKEEPSLRDTLFAFDPVEIRHVYAVPNFISEDYFTQTTRAELRLRWDWDPLRTDPRFQKMLADPEPKTMY